MEVFNLEVGAMTYLRELLPKFMPQNRMVLSYILGHEVVVDKLRLVPWWCTLDECRSNLFG